MDQSKPKIALIDPDPARRDGLRQVINRWGYRPFSFEKDVICLDNLFSLDPDLVIVCRLSMPRICRLLYTLKTLNYRLPVLIIPYLEEIDEFNKTNQFDDVFMIEENIDGASYRRIIEELLTKSSPKADSAPPFIVGQTPEMLRIKKMVLKLSRNRETVLIKGAGGTGKEHVARVLHHLSAKADDFFIKVNSAGLTHRLLDGRLFHSDTLNHGPAASARQASEKRGTIFFESIEKMPFSLQGSLLDFLECGEPGFWKAETIDAMDYRIIASAAEDIERQVEQKKFRKDLYFRLSSIDMKIPALKDRRADISLLADFFADRACMESGRSYFDLSEKIKQTLGLFEWPLNVEELEQTVKNAIANGGEIGLLDHFRMAQGKNSQFNDFHLQIEQTDAFSDVAGFLKNANNLSLKEISKNYVAHTEKIFMKKALDLTNWNRKKAATKLSISYKSLLNKISEYDL